MKVFLITAVVALTLTGCKSKSKYNADNYDAGGPTITSGLHNGTIGRADISGFDCFVFITNTGSGSISCLNKVEEK